MPKIFSSFGQTVLRRPEHEAGHRSVLRGEVDDPDQNHKKSKMTWKPRLLE